MATTQSPVPGSAAGSPPAGSGSPRIRLARLAEQAALRVPGVVRTDPGTAGTFGTASAGERITGVRCVAADAGGYEVALRLVCGLVPLDLVAQAVRGAVLAAADRAGILVSAVDVHIADVVAPTA
jgi:hypothetical protein